MSTLHKPAIQAPTSLRGGQTESDLSVSEKATPVRQQFVSAALNMSWQLAVVVLVPIIGGVEIDKAIGSDEVFTFIGLAIAIIGSGFVMWRTMRAANRLPVPKLSASEKQAIKKSYEEEDND